MTRRYELSLILAPMITAITPHTFASEPPAKGPGVRLEVSEASVGTQYLTDSKGRSLYLFTRDVKGASSCAADCSRSWQPLRSFGYATTGDKAVDPKKIGSIKRVDGTEQVTYAGWPLYYFHRDAKAGDVEGQGVIEFGAAWYLVSPSGTKMQVPPKAARSASEHHQVAQDLRARLAKLSAQYGEKEAVLSRIPSERENLNNLRAARLAAADAVSQFEKAPPDQEKAAKAEAESKLDELAVRLEAVEGRLEHGKTPH